MQSRSGYVALRYFRSSEQGETDRGRMSRVHHLLEHLRHRRRVAGDHPIRGRPVER